MNDSNFITSIALLTGSVSLLVTIINNISIWKLSKSSHHHDVRSQLSFLFHNLIKATSEIYLLETESDKLREDITYKVRLGNARNERIVVVKQIEAIEILYTTLLSDIEYVELAKSEFALFNYELTEKYYSIAIKKAIGNSKVYCKRYYADFLYRTKNDLEGSKVYNECIVAYESNAGKIINGTTNRMWMNSEKFNDNTKSALAKYHEARRYFEMITEESSRRHFMDQLNLDAGSLINEGKIA